jgi:cytochrome P450
MATDVLSALFSTPLVYVALTLALVWVVKALLQRPANIPPFPVKPYPIIGHIPFLKKSPRETIGEWVKDTGEIFSLYMGPTLVVVLNSYEVLKETLVKQPDHFTDRPPSYLGTVSPDGEKGIIANSGPEWKEQRSTAMGILRNFGMGKKSLAEDIQNEIAAYMKELTNYKGKPAEVRTLTNSSVSNIICAIIVGQRFEYDDPFFVNFMHIFNEQVRLLAQTGPLQWFHWLRFLPGDYFNGKKIQKNQETLVNYFSDRYIKESAQTLDENNVDNFINAYLIEMKKKEKNGESTTLDKINLRRVIANLFVAGSETTSTTILWFMLYMIHNPNVQKKVYKEIEEVVGTAREPTLNDKTKLHYLNAAIMETQRKASIVPLSLVHMCTADVKVRGYTIPKGAHIWPNLDAVLWDKKTWGDPENFRPERYLDADGSVTVPEQFIPFSLGRRVCLGESLAKMELFLFLSTMIQKFQLLPANPKELPPLKSVFGVTSAPLPYELRFVERASA